MSKLNHIVKGPISPNLMVEIQKTGNNKTGADLIFLGTIRADEVNGKVVKEIIYSAYTEMAENIFSKIKMDIIKKHNIDTIHILHSVGTVVAGEISMLVYVRSKHRAEAYAANRDAVEMIKAYAPVWKKEIYSDNSYDWVNCEHCSHAHKHIH